MADRVMLQDALDGHDWSRYAGPGSAARLRGETARRRRRGTVLGVAALAAVGAALPAVWPASPPRQTTAATSVPPHIPGAPILPKGAPYKPLAGGVLGEGTVGGVFWQDAWATIPSQSADNSEPVVTCQFVTVGMSTQILACGEGATVWPSNSGFDIAVESVEKRFAIPLVVADGGVRAGTTALTLHWSDGRSQNVPFGSDLRAAFAFLPDDAPSTLVEQGPYGTRTHALTVKPIGAWHADLQHQTQVALTVPPAVTKPTGAPRLAKVPGGQTLSAAILGQGEAGGHQWELAYRMVPSGSADNSSPVVMCEDLTLDGTTTNQGCSSGTLLLDTPLPQLAEWSADQGPVSPLLMATVSPDQQTTAVGFQWSDGTQSLSPVTAFDGGRYTTLAFDPAKPPAFLLLVGAYGEKKLPIVAQGGVTWSIG